MKKKILLLLVLSFISLLVNGQISDNVRVKDTRYESKNPSNYGSVAEFEFKESQAIDIISSSAPWSGLFTFAPWYDDSGGPNHQLAFNKDGTYWRMGYVGKLSNRQDKWESWSKFIQGDINGVIQSRLDVNGTIRAKKVKIESTGWADFVFKPEYQLPPLSEVEEHILEHGHLPNIPSESEVKENGVELGEMQIKLLQKIEELTLYLIEQKQEIKSLRDENQTIKQTLEKFKNN